MASSKFASESFEGDGSVSFTLAGITLYGPTQHGILLLHSEQEKTRHLIRSLSMTLESGQVLSWETESPVITVRASSAGER